MASSGREKFLMMAVVLSAVGFGGSYAYQSVGGEDIWLQQSDIDERQGSIDTMLDKQTDSGKIIQRYSEMMSELVVNGEDSEQQLAVQEQITAILRQAKLQGKYDSINRKEPVKEDDFKILSVTIDDIKCTPQELGVLLNLIEKQSEVMEVTRCAINNEVRDNGEIYGRQYEAEQDQQRLLNGLLSVDLEISRLMEYRKGEDRPKKRNQRRSR